MKTRASGIAAGVQEASMEGPGLHTQRNTVSAFILSFLAILFSSSATAQTTPPNGVEATTVPVAVPAGLAYDSAGNLYIAAMNDQVIRKVDLNGVITTVAGTGSQGFSGDGGSATSAQLDSPTGVALDAAGNLYIADSHNHRIREVVNGVINTVVGTGTRGFSGDGGAATSAALNLPTAISLDAAGNLYIADTRNERIRKVAAGVITTVAGNGEQVYSGDGGPALQAGLDSPSGVAADPLVANKFYIGDTHNQRIRQVDASGVITTIAGTGTKSFSGDGSGGASAGLARPRGLAMDASGHLLIADSDNNRIRLLSNGTISTIAGNGEQTFSGDTGLATNAALDTPRTTAVSSTGVVALTDTNNQRVRAINLKGDITTVAGVAPTASESLVLSGVTTTVYGSGSLTATFSFGSSVATGAVTLLDSAAPAGAPPAATATLTGNTATFSLASLSAGQHSLIANFAGDSSNPAIASGVYVVTVTALPITATANSVSILYGQPIPALTGTLNGVLPVDTANVNASFTTTATQSSPVGVYPISVALTGSAAPNYTATLSAPAALTITSASSRTVLTTSNPAPNFAVPLTLTATVTSSTTGTPTGTVQFLNGATVLGSGTLNAGGVATLSVSALPLGVSSITAVYLGDTNYATSTSNAVTETVTSADFTFALQTGGSGNQTVAPGHTATFPFTVSSALATFPQAVTFTVSGLPPGATYTLSPPSIAAGAGSTAMTLTVQTANTAATLTPAPQPGHHPWPAVALGVLLLPFSARRFRRLSKNFSRRGLLLVWMLFGLAAAGALTGCGGGGFFNHPQQSYTIVVTATSGAVSHSANVTLTVQ